MVFYFFVYRDVVQKSRKVEGVRLSNGKVLSNVRTVNGLMQQKAMPIAAVKFEGWLATPVKEGDHHPLLHDETLAETLARHAKEQTTTRRTHTNKTKKHQTPPEPEKKKPSKFAESIVSSEEISNDLNLVEPDFHPPVKTVTVGIAQSTPSRGGCMRVRTLEESLATSLIIKRQNSAEQGSSLGKTESTCSSSSSVHFGTVEIRKYVRCLGDNPACSNGPPITIDWKYQEAGAIPVDDYDDDREREPPIQVSYYDRVEILRRLGYSRQEMLEAERQRKKDQALREETVYRLKFMEREEKTENVKRKIKSVLHLTSH